MRFLQVLVPLALVADSALASNWFTKAAYNKWHETELERWLSDHNVPYPTPSDRKDLEKLVKDNWNNYAVFPYNNWDSEQLSAYLKLKGIQTKKAAQQDKASLVTQVQNTWYETEDKAQQAWGSVKDWILDGWTDSQLKAFCDKHGIPVPQPRTRDTLLQKVRSSYETVAQKSGEYYSYPGNWLYESWSESDLKEWLDTNGFPAPQPSTRDKLIASVRRNSRLASLRLQDQVNNLKGNAQQTIDTLTDAVIDAWSESDLKNFADKNGIKVPQGTKTQELRALIRKHRAELLGDTVSGTAASAFGAATSNIAQQGAKATDAAAEAYAKAFDSAVDTWSESRLKGYLDARGIPVPQKSKADELRALVRKNAHKAASGWNAWTFDDFTVENLKAYLAANGNAAAKKASEQAGVTRDELVKAANSAYSSASSAGGPQYASATNYLAKQTQAAKDNVFDTWTESELKAYLDSYGIPVPQGTKIEELKAYARRQATYYRYGTSSPTGTIFAKIGEGLQETWEWVKGQLKIGADVAKENVDAASDAAHKKIKEEL